MTTRHKTESKRRLLTASASRVRPMPGLFLVVVALMTAMAAAADEELSPAEFAFRKAIELQQQGDFEAAAKAWGLFVLKHPSHRFAPQGFLNRGICQLKANQLEAAEGTLRRVIVKFPQFDMLESAYFYLGITQYNLAQKGKSESFASAAQTFATLESKFPRSKYLSQAIYYRGECLYALGEHRKAAECYARFVEFFPDSELAAEAIYGLGVCQEELGQYREAGATYDRFIKRYEKHPLALEVVMRRGETLFGIEQYEAAAEWFAYAAARRGFPLADYATLRQAAALARLRRYADAGATYASVAENFPDSAHKDFACLSAGKSYFLSGDCDKAAPLLRNATAAGGEVATEAAHWFAQCLLKQGKPAEALAVVDRVIDAAPATVQLLMDRADATRAITHRRGEAVKLYAAIAQEYPNDPLADSALYMAAFTALEESDYSASQDYANALLKRYPRSDLAPDAMAISAEANLRAGNLAEAEQRYDELIRRRSDRPEIDAWRLRYALALYLQQKYAETIVAVKPLLTEIQTKAMRAEALHLLGASQTRLKQDDAALESLNDSLATDSQWRQADETLLFLAEIHRRRKDLAEAVACLKRLLAELPQSKLADQAYYWLGEHAYAAGDWRDAAAAYQRVLDGWPDSPLLANVLFSLGWTQLALNNAAEAEKTFDRLLGDFPKHDLALRSLLGRATSRQSQAKYGPAMDDLNIVLADADSERTKADARYVLGLCQMGLNKPAEALVTFQSILEQWPDYANADKVLFEWAWALESAGDAAEATRRFGQLVREYPDSPLAAESLYQLGESRYRVGQYSEAARFFRDAAERAAEPALQEKARHRLGWCLFKQEQWDDARRAFADQRTVAPDGKRAGDAAFMEGQCLMKLGQYEDALAAFDEALQPETDEFQALALLRGAEAAAQLGQWEKSLARSSKAAGQFPEAACLPEILVEQGWAQQNLGHLDAAAALYRQAVAKTDRETAARAQYLLGEILMQQGKQAEAIERFDEVRYGYGYPQWQANATYQAARCHETLGHDDQALRLYEELIDKYPDSEKAADAQTRIDALQVAPKPTDPEAGTP